jgi:MEMO1 family protein
MQAGDEPSIGKPSPEKPRIRLLETQVVQETGSEGILLLDPEGLFEDPVFVPQGLLAVVASFTGARTLAEIAAQLGQDFGQEVPLSFLEQVVADLDARLCLEGDRVEAARQERRIAFTALVARPAVHAGSGGYPAAAEDCAKALDQLLGDLRPTRPDAPLLGLVAPHIDLDRGRVGYREAYSSLRQHPPSDLYILFGTSHKGGTSSLIPCRIPFETPLGLVDTDCAFIDDFLRELGPEGGLEASLDEEILHLREHSLEFQVLLLKKVLGDHPFRIVPFLTGLLPDLPGDDPAVQRQLEVLERLVRNYPGHVSFVAGADMSHLGPFFGDPDLVDAELLGNLETLDRGSLDFLLQGRPAEFYAHVHEEDNPRRICGGAPMFYTIELARRMDPSCRIELLHYGQAVAPDGSQVVSHASLLLHGQA